MLLKSRYFDILRPPLSEGLAYSL